ncbi:arginine--tRNA ligase [Philodulcilactobacillus myokoensis]|uniref:Arginine--tRNA ligase n=1 Tax=Philodulcilactobacillus myokoensis TaxID=2929573 RepID=A0A9W6ESR0_9LACO|nr:arginine--tRNA ligase [Philodulcilactobacillus myokoensis]GLB46732.1 arginine--tRNA ligase [Philodulcilactobacillus myokoensis]
MDYKQTIADNISSALDHKINRKDIEAKIEVPKNSKMGDLAFPTFILAKELHQAPQIIAQNLVKQINTEGFDKVVATGPYINFFLNKSKFSNDVLDLILKQQQNYGNNQRGNQRNVTIDMSSPNIAKPISMGHLRSTVIGNSIANILSKNGYHPIKDNHLGDWGTQFGKLITAYLKWGNEKDVEADPINKLVEYYVHFHKVDKEHPELDDEAREWFKKLENGNQEAINLWKWFRDVSLKSFNKTYDKLGVKFDTYNGESFYNDKMDEVIQMLKDKHLLKKSRGAEIVDLQKYNLNPALILKSDGASLYITRDLATAIYRDRTYHPAMNLYVVGSEQILYFKQLKAVLKEMGIPSADNLHHVPFGLILSNGQKLSTRSGRIILLNKVLDDSVKLAKEQIQEKNPDLPNKDNVANEVGVGAIIFGDLKNNRMDSINFVLKDQLRFEGETGPYVQYAHARAESILRKAHVSSQSIVSGSKSVSDPAAWDVLKLLNDFPRIVKMACDEFEPSDIAKYSLKLSKAFNKYYAHTKVLVKDDELVARLSLVKSISIVLKEALRLLGVKAPDQM